MSSENKGLFEEILADETLAGVAEYLYDNTDVTIDRRGNVIDYVDVPDIEFAENYAYISEEDYNKIAEAIREQAKNVRYYDGYILLNDNHTLHQIDNPEFDEYDYSTSVEDACEAFRLETGLSLYLLGRSGRRVCVEDSFSSFVNYDYLKEIQEKLENEVIAKHAVNESANEQVFYAVDTLGDSKENSRTYTQLQLYDFAKELIDIEEESSDKSQYKNRPKLTKNLNDIKAVLNWFNYEIKDAGMELTEDIDTTQFIIVGITKDGSRQFYNVSSAPHWVDDCDDATIFDDQAEAHKVFYEIDKKPFKRVFVPNFDRAALKEELDINKIDEDEFLTVAEQIASFLKGMDMDMDDVSGKITHYDVNMFTDCCEDRIRIKWTSYMNKNRVKSNSKILPAMLTQMMADDTRFDEVVDIFINEVDNEVIHHSDLGAIYVEMIASDEFEPKTKAEEVKEAYVHARSEDDIREIDTGLTHKIDYIILGDVQGQLSDGIWENSPAMNKYWKHLDTEFKDGKVFIVVNNIGHMEDVYRGTRRDFRFLESPFRHMSDDEIKKWVANKIKQIAKHEAQDNNNSPEYAWRADNDTELEYFDSVVTVADAYRTWSKLLGRPVKNPINDIIIKTTPELEIGDVVNGKVLTEIKPDEKDNYWSYLVFENGDEQKVSKHQNHKVNKPTEETFNESIEDENKFAQYVFPLFTKEDREKAKYYGLVIDDEDEDNSYVSGSYKDIKSFADNYLGYELVDDYLTLYESKEHKESVYAEEPASKEEIESELKNITHNFTDRQGTAKCSFKEEADIGHDILKQYYDKVEVEEQGEWYHLIYKDLLELDESIKEDISADDEVVIGLYGDEVNGFDSVDQLAQHFEDNDIKVISKSGDMEYGWDLEVKGNARDIYRLVNGKITGYNCNSTQEFVDRYRIDESKYSEDKVINENIDDEIEEIIASSESHSYRMLSRFKSDFKYLLGSVLEANDGILTDSAISHALWCKDIHKQADAMRKIYDKLQEKPTWISIEEINNYEKTALSNTIKNESTRIEENTKIGKDLKIGDLFVCPETGKQFKVLDTLGNDGQTLNIKVKEFETGEESVINIGVNSPWETVTIVESKLDESLLQDLHRDHKAIKDTYGQEVYDALDAYIENGNDLGDVLYKESEWNKFVDWAKKERGIEVKSNLEESKSIKEAPDADGILYDYEVGAKYNDIANAEMKQNAEYRKKIRELKAEISKLVPEVQKIINILRESGKTYYDLRVPYKGFALRNARAEAQVYTNSKYNLNKVPAGSAYLVINKNNGSDERIACGTAVTENGEIISNWDNGSWTNFNMSDPGYATVKALETFLDYFDVIKEKFYSEFNKTAESKSIKESKEIVKNILSRQLKDNKVKPFKDAKECPRGFAFKSSNGSSGEVSYRCKDYVFAIVDGELKVMTDAEAGWNWSETIYKK